MSNFTNTSFEEASESMDQFNLDLEEELLKLKMSSQSQVAQLLIVPIEEEIRLSSYNIINYKDFEKIKDDFKVAQKCCDKLTELKKDNLEIENNKVISNFKENVEKTIKFSSQKPQTKDLFKGIVQTISNETDKKIPQFKFNITNGIVFINRIDKNATSNVHDVIYYKEGKIVGVISAMPEASPDNSRVYNIINDFKNQYLIRGKHTAKIVNETKKPQLEIQKIGGIRAI